jgi:hypothetical protein
MLANVGLGLEKSARLFAVASVLASPESVCTVLGPAAAHCPTDGDLTPISRLC